MSNSLSFDSQVNDTGKGLFDRGQVINNLVKYQFLIKTCISDNI